MPTPMKNMRVGMATFTQLIDTSLFSQGFKESFLEVGYR